jgi:hypothetical protein
MSRQANLKPLPHAGGPGHQLFLGGGSKVGLAVEALPRKPTESCPRNRASPSLAGPGGAGVLPRSAAGKTGRSMATRAAGADSGDAVAGHAVPHRARLHQDTARAASHAGEEAGDAVGRIGEAALRVPRRPSDVVGRQKRLDLLDAAGIEARRVHPDAAQDGHVRHPRSPDATAHISSPLARRPRPRG